MPHQTTPYSIETERACAIDEMRRWLDAHGDDTGEMHAVGAEQSRIANDHLPQTTEDFVALITKNPEALRHTSRFQQDNARACLVDWAEINLYDAVEGLLDAWRQEKKEMTLLEARFPQGGA